MSEYFSVEVILPYSIGFRLQSPVRVLYDRLATIIIHVDTVLKIKR
jgi:hypothetical protein